MGSGRAAEEEYPALCGCIGCQYSRVEFIILIARFLSSGLVRLALQQTDLLRHIRPHRLPKVTTLPAVQLPRVRVGLREVVPQPRVHVLRHGRSAENGLIRHPASLVEIDQLGIHVGPCRPSACWVWCGRRGARNIDRRVVLRDEITPDFYSVSIDDKTRGPPSRWKYVLRIASLNCGPWFGVAGPRYAVTSVRCAAKGTEYW